jgi:hypothetical protein
MDTANFPHDVTGSALSGHQTRSSRISLLCSDCHTESISRFDARTYSPWITVRKITPVPTVTNRPCHDRTEIPLFIRMNKKPPRQKAWWSCAQVKGDLRNVLRQVFIPGSARPYGSTG